MQSQTHSHIHLNSFLPIRRICSFIGNLLFAVSRMQFFRTGNGIKRHPGFFFFSFFFLLLILMKWMSSLCELIDLQKSNVVIIPERSTGNISKSQLICQGGWQDTVLFCSILLGRNQSSLHSSNWNICRRILNNFGHSYF